MVLRAAQGMLLDGREAFIRGLREFSPDATGGVEPQLAEPVLL